VRLHKSGFIFLILFTSGANIVSVQLLETEHVMAQKHVAIFLPPFLDLILEGTKTMESRFSRIRCAPYGQVQADDVVLMKRSGGLVEGEFTVAQVESYRDLTDTCLRTLADRYGKALCADADAHFWEVRRGSRYATLLSVAYPTRYPHPFPYQKRDRRGWIVLNEQAS
jgi:predicted transcriptional regulator